MTIMLGKSRGLGGDCPVRPAAPGMAIPSSSVGACQGQKGSLGRVPSPTVRYRDPGIQGRCSALRGGVGGESPWSGAECSEPDGAVFPGAGHGVRVSPAGSP